MIAWNKLVDDASMRTSRQVIEFSTPEEAKEAAGCWVSRLDDVSKRYFARIRGVAQFADAFLNDDAELISLVGPKYNILEHGTIAIALTYGVNTACDFLKREALHLNEVFAERVNRLRGILGIPSE